MSEPEPELGLGVVRGLAKAMVKVWFPAAEETRIYAWPGAPLLRVKFLPGERVIWPGGSGVVEGGGRLRKERRARRACQLTRPQNA